MKSKENNLSSVPSCPSFLSSRKRRFFSIYRIIYRISYLFLFFLDMALEIFIFLQELF
ncbi:hypothetical membrane protein [Syntrophus aciditrophicus SB]|uniref:Hypothetical membrane protein n=1 Tax=Syntrophus aciditrophicus (strain SB) TaxID=56780 RepID=Q2LX76_SYNAS|nr:hypothetical membrane protein [Syntrophus aciditrophicus SB]